MLGTSQPAILKTERAPDPQVSTLARYVRALGRATGREAALELTAVIGDDRFSFTLPPTRGLDEMDLVATATSDESPATTVWRLRAWDDAAIQDRFVAESLIAISGDELGDITRWPGDARVRRALRRALPDRGEQAIGMFVRYWDDFRNQMKPGDLVIVPFLARRAISGVIEGDYEYRESETDPRLRHVRRVRWVRSDRRDDLPEGIRKVVNAPGTICRVNAPGAASWLAG